MYKEQILKLLEAIRDDKLAEVQKICKEIIINTKSKQIEVIDQIFADELLQSIQPITMKLKWR